MLTDLFYCFSGCSSLTTIYADSTWTLLSSGISGSQCFYQCSSLVGGNGTVWSSSNTGYTYFCIDTASTPGYMVAASPFGLELQFDVLSDGTLGQTVGISAQFPLVAASAVRPLWEPTGAAAQLMQFAADARAADARWQRVRDTVFSTVVQDGTVTRALYCVPAFVKFRVYADELRDAKIYLQSGTAIL